MKKRDHLTFGDLLRDSKRNHIKNLRKELRDRISYVNAYYRHKKPIIIHDHIIDITIAEGVIREIKKLIRLADKDFSMHFNK